jgi:sugar/nucleoside kinase (ribokinase family)
MRSALVAGHVCVDLVPALPGLPAVRPGELAEVGPLDVHAGGCVANTGSALAALGAPVQVAGDVGADELGTLLVRLLAAGGMRADQVRPVPGWSTSYSLVLQPPGLDRSFWHHVGANAAFDGTGLSLAGTDLLHLGYPSLLPALLRSGAGPLRALLARARDAGASTSLDLAVLDPDSAAAGQDWAALLARVLPLVDVLTPSLDDVRSALRTDAAATPADLRRTARLLLEMGPAVVMLTAGAAGLQLCTAPAARLAGAGATFAGDPARQARWSDQDLFVPAPPVPVRTTLGAGDAATAGLLYGLLADLDPLASLELAARTAAARVSGTPIRPVPPG